jgi:hypothetical protein
VAGSIARLRTVDSTGLGLHENGLALFFLVICSLLRSAETPSHTHGQNGKEEKEESVWRPGSVQLVLNANESDEKSSLSYSQCMWPLFVGLVEAFAHQQIHVARQRIQRGRRRDSQLRNS